MNGVKGLRIQGGLGRSGIEDALRESLGFLGCVEAQDSDEQFQSTSKQACLYDVGLDILARASELFGGDYAAA